MNMLNDIANNYFLFKIFERLVDLKFNEKIEKIGGWPSMLRQFGSPLQLNHYRYCGTVSKNRNINPTQEISIINSPYSTKWFEKYGDDVDHLKNLKYEKVELYCTGRSQLQYKQRIILA